ncbi:MAG: helix-hairpin-helix domain-containing protein, partial [Bacteroidota bacterium]
AARKAVVKKATTKKATTKKTATKKTTTVDKLTKVEGIGPKIEKLLKEDGIDTFAKLAKASKTKLKAILNAAGPRFKMHTPDTWAAQAKMAAKGEWDKLAKWQKELKGGK